MGAFAFPGVGDITRVGMVMVWRLWGVTAPATGFGMAGSIQRWPSLRSTTGQ